MAEQKKKSKYPYNEKHREFRKKLLAINKKHDGRVKRHVIKGNEYFDVKNKQGTKDRYIFDAKPPHHLQNAFVHNKQGKLVHQTYHPTTGRPLLHQHKKKKSQTKTKKAAPKKKPATRTI